MGVLNKIEVEGLFGHYNYTIPLKSGVRKDICFLTGPNGYGKSTILKLIYAFLKADARTLVETPFYRIAFFMRDYKVVILQERTEGNDGNEENSVNDDEQHISVKLSITVYDIRDERIIESSHFEDKEIGSVEIPLFPPSLAVYLASLKVEYVSDDRLLPKNTEKLGVTGKVAMLQTVISKYDEELTALYNIRLLDIIRKNNPTEVKCDGMGCDELITQAEAKLAAYNRIGLATRLVDDKTANDEWYLKLMQMKAIDNILDYDNVLYKRLNLLFDIIEEAGFSDKQLVLDIRNGLYFISGDTIVIPEELSSGEQHFIVQAISVLIKAESDSLVLIDEPELSYHPAWQMDYLKNLKRIAEIGKYQFILATHSAQIFDYHWNYTIDLYKQTTQDAEGVKEGD